jgi:hypothetical protein
LKTKYNFALIEINGMAKEKRTLKMNIVIYRWRSFGLLCRVAFWPFSNVSEEQCVFIFRVDEMSAHSQYATRLNNQEDRHLYSYSKNPKS